MDVEVPGQYIELRGSTQLGFKRGAVSLDLQGQYEVGLNTLRICCSLNNLLCCKTKA